MVLMGGLLRDEVINNIKIDTSRIADTSNYSLNNSRDIKYIVIHYTGNDKDTAENNAKYFQARNRESSAHFFVDDISMYQSVALVHTAWHCGTKKTYYHADCRNANSVGLEMCCSGGYKVSDKTIKNAAHLCAYLCKKLEIKSSDVDKYVVRHYDVTHKICPAQMVGDNNLEWIRFKELVKSIMNNKPAASSAFKEYLIRANTDTVAIHTEPKNDSQVVRALTINVKYTIVAEDGYWGRLKSGIGWIDLRRVEKL